MTYPTTDRPRTDKQRLLDVCLRSSSLGVGLDAHVTAARSAGQSWQSIADSIAAATGESVTDATLTNWYAPKETA